MTLRAEDPGPCARRETKATTKEVAAAGGGGGSFSSTAALRKAEERPRLGSRRQHLARGPPPRPPPLPQPGIDAYEARKQRVPEGAVVPGCGSEVKRPGPTHRQPSDHTRAPLFAMRGADGEAPAPSRACSVFRLPARAGEKGGAGCSCALRRAGPLRTVRGGRMEPAPRFDSQHSERRGRAAREAARGGAPGRASKQ